MKERINKFLASNGVTSRRRADQMIESGKVLLNGKRLTKLGTIIDTEYDKVHVQGKLIKPAASYRYIAVHKPRGYVSTRARFENEKSVFSLVPNNKGLKIAGRLDKESQGLVILSDDGDLINELTHPRYGHEKNYEIMLDRQFLKPHIRQLQNGVRIPEGLAKADRITARGNVVRMTLHQGWNRQVRKMFEALGYTPTKLQRVGIGKLDLGNLPSGKTRAVERADLIPLQTRK